MHASHGLVSVLLGFLLLGCGADTEASPDANPAVPSDGGIEAGPIEAGPAVDAAIDAGARSCAFGDQTVASGEEVVAYVSPSVPLGDRCVESNRRCVDGTLLGDPAAMHPRCEVDGDLQVYVSPEGSDSADGRSLETPLRTLRAALLIVDAFAGRYEQATVHVAAGQIDEIGELRVSHPVRIVGAGRSESRVSFRIVRSQASLRVVSGGVEIEDLEIAVELTHSLADGVHIGGRGEFGTGITIGEYLRESEPPPIDGVRLRRLRISRTGFTAAAISIFGRTQDVVVEDIEMRGNHSTATILHWGGHTSVAPAPQALVDPSYEVFATYHPHDITIRDLDIERSARFAIVSSSYDVRLERYRGTTSEVLLMLPGDEVDLYADEDRGQIMHNIDIGDFDVDLRSGRSEHVIRTSATGTSKVDFMRRTLPMQNVSVHDIRVRSLDRSRGGTFRYGINANGTRGDNVSFRRIELGEVASRPWDAGDRLLSSFGVYLRDARGVTVEDIQCRGRYGLGLVDSQNITVRGFDARYLDTGSTLRSFGVFTQQNPDGELADITLEAVRVEGYDVGIAYPTEDACAPFTLRELEIVDSQEIAERPAPCPRVP